jgi:hypothetical protein
LPRGADSGFGVVQEGVYGLARHGGRSHEVEERDGACDSGAVRRYRGLEGLGSLEGLEGLGSLEGLEGLEGLGSCAADFLRKRRLTSPV